MLCETLVQVLRVFEYSFSAAPTNVYPAQVACFLTRGDLYQSWEAGARVFDKHLIDADWALNNANWMWLSCSSFFYQYFRSVVASPCCCCSCCCCVPCSRELALQGHLAPSATCSPSRTRWLVSTIIMSYDPPYLPRCTAGCTPLSPSERRRTPRATTSRSTCRNWQGCRTGGSTVSQPSD